MPQALLQTIRPTVLPSEVAAFIARDIKEREMPPYIVLCFSVRCVVLRSFEVYLCVVWMYALGMVKSCAHDLVAADLL
jgi:hypothetical protein